MSEIREQLPEKSGELGRLRWKCRRGMLELDKILLSFLDQYYIDLSVTQKALFQRLLAEQDALLYSWFIKKNVPEDTEIASMVSSILMSYRPWGPLEEVGDHS